MSIKLPTPTQYDGKSPQFNAWTGEVKAYLTAHNIYIGDLLEESTRSQVPMVIATMQRNAVADDLQRFNAPYLQAVNGDDDNYEDYVDRWEAMEKEEGRHCPLQPDTELCPCDKARIRATLHHEESDETIE
eukprot:3626708-Amphidinium_carterae.1